MSCPDTCVIQITFLLNSAIRYGPKRDEAKRYIVTGQAYSLDWVYGACNRGKKRDHAMAALS